MSRLRNEASFRLLTADISKSDFKPVFYATMPSCEEATFECGCRVLVVSPDDDWTLTLKFCAEHKPYAAQLDFAPEVELKSVDARTALDWQEICDEINAMVYRVDKMRVYAVMVTYYIDGEGMEAERYQIDRDGGYADYRRFMKYLAQRDPASLSDEEEQLMMDAYQILRRNHEGEWTAIVDGKTYPFQRGRNPMGALCELFDWNRDLLITDLTGISATFFDRSEYAGDASDQIANVVEEHNENATNLQLKFTDGGQVRIFKDYHP